MTSLGLACTSLSVTGSLTVSGQWTANANGTYIDKTTTTGTEQIVVPGTCLYVSGTVKTCESLPSPLAGLGFKAVSCVDTTTGCDCSARVQQSGGAGVVSVLASSNGNYATSGNTITIDGATPYAYCVSGSEMTWSPQTTSPTISGTVVFQKGGSTGMGGTVGTAGSTGTGGSETGGMAGGGGGAKATGGAGGSAGKGGSNGAAYRQPGFP